MAKGGGILLDGYLVVNAGEDSCCIFTPKWKLKKKITLPGEGPRRACMGKPGFVYIANTFSGTIDRLEISTGCVTSAQCGSCITGICYMTGMEKVVVACGESNRLFLLDGETLQIEKSVPCGNFPLAIDYSETLERLAVACFLDHRIDFFDENLEQINTKELPGYGCDMIQEKDGSFYCSHGMEGGAGFSKFLGDGSLKYRINLESFPTTAVRMKEKIALAHTGGGEILILEEATGKLIRRVECFMPDDIAITEDGIAVSSMGEDKIFLLDWEGNLLKTKKTGKEPRGIVRLFD